MIPIILRMFPIFVSVNDPEMNLILWKREVKNRISLLLIRKNLINPNILQEKFKKDRSEILTNLGLNLQKIRQEDNHVIKIIFF